MNNPLLLFALLFFVLSCKKNTNNTSGNPVSPFTDFIKTIRTTSFRDNQKTGDFRSYRFTYTNAGLVDTMYILDSTGTISWVYTYERHGTYTLFQRYSSPNLLNPRRLDSFINYPDDRPKTRYSFRDFPNLVSNTSQFSYDNQNRLTRFEETGPAQLLPNWISIQWSNDNATYIDGYGAPTRPYQSPIGTYQYDATRPAQPADPATLYSMMEWGIPLIHSRQHANSFRSYLNLGMEALQEVKWVNNRIESYQMVELPGTYTLWEFTYY